MAVLVLLAGQSLPAIPAAERLVDLNIRHWGAESGIPEETFAALQTTRDGYFWLASNHGLVRFDGKRATVFTLGDSFRATGTGSCSGSAFNALRSGADGALWAGTLGGCVFRIVPDRFGSFANFRLEAFLPRQADRRAAAVVGIWDLPDRSGMQIVRRRSVSALNFADTGKSTSSPRPGLKALAGQEIVMATPPGELLIEAAAREAGGRLWAILSDQFVYSVEAGSSVWVRRFSAGPDTWRILVDRQGAVWVASAGGLNGWRNGVTRRWDGRHGLEDVRSVHEDQGGCIWAGMVSKVARLCDGNLETMPIGDEQEEIVSVFEQDAQGNVWMAGTFGNLFRMQPATFRTYTRRQGLPSSHVSGVAIDRDGQVWASLRSSGLVKISDGRAVFTRTGPELVDVQALVPHPRAGVLAAGARGVFAVDDRRAQPVLREPGLSSFQTVVAMFWESPDTLLYSNGSTIQRIRYITPPDGTPPGGGAGESWQITAVEGPNRIRQWTRDPRGGRVWAVAQYQGLYVKEEGRFRRASNAPADRTRAWYCVRADQDGLLWVGTADGLEIYSTLEGRFITRQPLLVGDQVFHTVQDKYGNVWCATRLGLVRLDRQHALAAVAARPDQPAPHLQMERYGDAQFLATTNFGLATSATGVADREGRLWFPGLQGLVSLQPARFERSSVAPSVLLLQVSGDGRALDVNAPLNLSPGTRNLEFAFQTIRFDLLGGEFCRLQLRGFDHDWLSCSDRQTAQYTNLAPGNYEFVLQTSSRADSWNGRELRVPIAIAAAYYQRRWVQALAALLLAATLGWVVRHRHRLQLDRTRLLEAKVEERTVKLEAAMQAAQSASKAKSQFLATMSHEIRTPMNGVLGAAQLLAGSPLSGEQREVVNIIQRSGEHLLGVVNDVLSLSSAESGKLSIEKQSVELRPLCEGLMTVFQPQADARGVALRLIFGAGVPGRVRTDPQRLRQILFNLLGNAVKFTPAGSIALRVAVDPAADSIRFDVEDTGLGVDPAAIPRLFEPFVQVDSSSTRRQGGTGLGLSIVKRFVEAMQGSIEVESSLGKGALFRVRLPLEVPEDDAAVEAVDAAAAGRDACEWGPLTVLVAEDNLINQTVVSKMLVRLGCTVRVAGNGAEALEMLKAARADLVLMDCQMPEIDGYQAARTIRGWEGAVGATPIIAVTASAMEDDRRKCQEAGMNDFVSKPVTFAALAEAIQRWRPRQPASAPEPTAPARSSR